MNFFVDIHVLFLFCFIPTGCMFLQSHVNFSENLALEKKTYNQVRMITLWFIHE